MKVSSVPSSRPLSRALGSLPWWTTRGRQFHTPTPSSTLATNRAHVNPQAMPWSSRQPPVLKTSRLWWPGSRTAPGGPACLPACRTELPSGPSVRLGLGDAGDSVLSCRVGGPVLCWSGRRVRQRPRPAGPSSPWTPARQRTPSQPSSRAEEPPTERQDSEEAAESVLRWGWPVTGTRGPRRQGHCHGGDQAPHPQVPRPCVSSLPECDFSPFKHQPAESLYAYNLLSLPPSSFTETSPHSPGAPPTPPLPHLAWPHHSSLPRFQQNPWPNTQACCSDIHS